MHNITSTIERPPEREICADCIRRVLLSAKTRPLAMTEPGYSAALGELAAMLDDCCGHHPAQYDREFRRLLAVWQNRHITAATEGPR